MRAWVYKVNSRGQGGARDWHFDQYFRYHGRQRFEMGGAERIRSPSSWACLRRVRAGDLFFCYQSDERKIYGLARAAGPGYESLPGLGRHDSIDFQPGGLRLKNPVGVSHPQACEVFRHVRAFTVPSRGTIHAVAADELRAVLRQLVAFNSGQRQVILRFAKSRP